MSHTTPEDVRARTERLRVERAARADKTVKRLEEIAARAKQTEPPIESPTT